VGVGGVREKGGERGGVRGEGRDGVEGRELGKGGGEERVGGKGVSEETSREREGPGKISEARGKDSINSVGLRFPPSAQL